MPVELVETLNTALPVHLVARDGLEALGLSPSTITWAAANGFSGEAGRTLAVPGENDCAIGFEDVEHAEGKAVEDRATHLTKDHREALRPFLDS